MSKKLKGGFRIHGEMNATNGFFVGCKLGLEC